MLKIPLMGALAHLNSATAIVVMLTIAMTKYYWIKVVFSHDNDQIALIKAKYPKFIYVRFHFFDFTTDERLLHCVRYLRVSSKNRSEDKWRLSRNRYTDWFICLLEQLAVLFDGLRTFIAYLWTTTAIYFYFIIHKKNTKTLETMPLNLSLFNHVLSMSPL